MIDATQATGQEDQDYFAGMEGEGLDDIGQAALSTAYLSMIQPGSTAITPTALAGTWRNTANDQNFGDTVEVIPLAFKIVWTERESTPPFFTVGRYPPNSIKVDIKKPKPGTRGFPTMTNPETGNKVEELFVYAVTLKDYPEQGILYFSPTVGSMKACKQWNSLLKSQYLPNGKIAPLFAFSWFLKLDLVPNPVRPAESITKFTSVVRGEIVASDLFKQYVQPQLTQARAENTVLLAAPEQSGDIAVIEDV